LRWGVEGELKCYNVRTYNYQMTNFDFRVLWTIVFPRSTFINCFDRIAGPYWAGSFKGMSDLRKLKINPNCWYHAKQDRPCYFEECA
jgi:hypothetical protein